MIAGEVLRLAAVHCLRGDDDRRPTFAGPRVYDSRFAAVNELNTDEDFTPVISVYTNEVDATNRGGDLGGDDFDTIVTLEIVAELAVTGEDGQSSDALGYGVSAKNDAAARRTLAVMVEQVRQTLCVAPEGVLFRRFWRGLRRCETENFSVPDLGLRWHRITMQLTVGGLTPCFDAVNGKPDLLTDLAAALPPGPTANAVNEMLAGFGPVATTPLLVPDVREHTATTIKDRTSDD